MDTSRQRPNSFPYLGKGLRRLSLPGAISRRRTGAAESGRGWFATLTRESALVVVAILVYFLVRGMMTTSVDRAYHHAYLLLDLERAMGIAWEGDLQRWASQVPGLDSTMAAIYIYGHWPVIALTLGWLLWRNGERFRTYRMAMVLSGLVGFAFFALYPMAPPRFLGELGFVDTVLRDTRSYRVLQPPALTNQYAALPSLHVGWNLLMGIAIYTTARPWYARLFAIVMPLAMYVSTILTANHFVLDGIVGSVVALAGLAAAIYIRSRKGTSTAIQVDPPGEDAGDQVIPPFTSDSQPAPSNA